MLRQRSRGFTLLELAVVVAILAILLAIGIPYLSRMQANNRINAAAERLEGELQQAQVEARGFGLRQERGGNVNFVPAQVSQDLNAGWVALQVSRQQPNQAVEVLKRWYVGPVESYPFSLVDVPSSALGAGDVGLVLEIGTAPSDGGAITAVASVPIQPDGSFFFNGGNAPGNLVIGSPEHRYLIELHPSGKVEREKL